MSDKDGINIKYKGSYLGGLILCVLGIALNVGLKELSSALGLPLYLDTIGTVVVAVIGGYLPGVIVGFFTNGIAAITDFSSLYYAVINVLIAVVSAWFSDRRLLKKPLGIAGFILALAALGGGLGTVLPWFLEGVPLETENLSTKLYEMGMTNVLAATLSANLIVDIADKIITVAIALIALKFIPGKIRDILKFQGWKQRPLSADEAHKARHSDTRLMSLRTKIMLILFVSFMTVATIAGTISSVLFREATIKEHKDLATGVAGVAAGMMNPNKVDHYMMYGELMVEYRDIKDRLYALKAGSPDIEYIYVYQIREDGCHVVFDLDAEEVEGSKPGEVIPFDESFKDYIPDLLAGKQIEPIITNDTYGWLLTVYQPVYNRSGECVCYAAVDVSMYDITQRLISFFVGLMSLFLAFFIVILVLVMWLVEYYLILPLNSMAMRAGAFAYESEESRKISIDKLRDLDIRTGDEIEHLYGSFRKTSEDSVNYVEEIQNKTEMISKMQNALIIVLADMVESRDKSTGDHVRKTAAYVRIILEEMRRQGLYPDIITDEYIDDVVISAPLHDVGKIKVPDAILNKPAKLTDEEYEIMKNHTIAGRDIINQAMDLVPEPGYLTEARNLAEYHHEKWNGKGYPHGIAGEDIPLSARAMAVADVFDALVSRRSYKEGFPFEKAMEIIVEGSGEHFDPKCVEAFVSAKDEVRRVSDRFIGLYDEGIFH